MRETDAGLEVVASLNQTALAKDWGAMIQHAVSLNRGSEIEFSIGFDSLRDQPVEHEDTGEELREILEARLHEISIVVEGADRSTALIEAASRSARCWRAPMSMEEYQADVERELDVEAFLVETALAEAAETRRAALPPRHVGNPQRDSPLPIEGRYVVHR